MSKLSQMFKFGYKTAMQKKSRKSSSSKPRYLGPSYVGGKFYDTNFRKPKRISQSTLRSIREEYGKVDGKRVSDRVAVDSYLSHMRRKFGNWKDGKFLGLFSDND